MQGKALVVTDSDEHNEEGHLIEAADIRAQQVAKRLRKYTGLRKEIGAPRYEQMNGSEITLIGWGSTYGAIKEASDILKKDGVATSILHFSEIWPFPAEETSSALKNARKTIAIENNATGQLANIIRGETGYKVNRLISRYDGRPISPQYIISELKREVS